MEEMKLNIDTGLTKVVIGDGDIEYGAFYFNPADVELSKRYDEVIKELEGIKIPDGATYNDILEISEKIKGMLDYLLNYNVSSEIFKVCNPLTPTRNGEFYFSNVLEGIAKVCKMATKQRISIKEEKIAKALAKYKK